MEKKQLVYIGVGFVFTIVFVALLTRHLTDLEFRRQFAQAAAPPSGRQTLRYFDGSKVKTPEDVMKAFRALMDGTVVRYDLEDKEAAKKAEPLLPYLR